MKDIFAAFFMLFVLFVSAIVTVFCFTILHGYLLELIFFLQDYPRVEAALFLFFVFSLFCVKDKQITDDHDHKEDVQS